MSKYFDLNERASFEDIASAAPEIKQSFKSKYLSAHFQKLEALERDLKRLPTPEEFFFLQTEKSFNAFTFIPFVTKYETVKHLYASTYSIGSKVVQALMDLHDAGFIDEITLLISDSMISRNPTVIDNLLSVASARGNVNVLFSWVHAKVCIMETKTNHYIVEGSGNWSENAQYEQYTFANSKGLFEFRKQLFTESKIIKRG